LKTPDTISIHELEVFFCVGVTDEERAQPQRLLVSIDVQHDFRAAFASDDLSDTVDYFEICRRVTALGDGAHWNLIETLAGDIANLVLDDFGARAATVEVKKFVIPQARWVAVKLARER
jgi:FolB domain-containing protein